MKIIRVTSCAECPCARWIEKAIYHCREKNITVSKHANSNTLHPSCPLEDDKCDSSRIMELGTQIGMLRIMLAEGVEKLTTITALAKLKYGNLDAGVWQEIQASEAFIERIEDDKGGE